MSEQEDSEWTKYFDGLDEFRDKIESVALRIAGTARRMRGDVTRQLLEQSCDDLHQISNRFGAHMMQLSRYVDDQHKKLILDMYAQNPLMARLMKLGQDYQGLKFPLPGGLTENDLPKA